VRQILANNKYDPLPIKLEHKKKNRTTTHRLKNVNGRVSHTSEKKPGPSPNYLKTKILQSRLSRIIQSASASPRNITPNVSLRRAECTS